MAAVGGGHDRLSELPDDLLHRILHFAPLKEAASTTALSRRWRAPLWLSSGALNLRTGRDNAHFFPRRDDFVPAATAALDAADAPITRLTWYGDSDRARSHYTALANAVLSHRAAGRVEELRLVVEDPYHYLSKRVGRYTVTLDSLPSETLRVLELTHSKGLLYTSEAVLPRLSSLRLTRGVQHLSSLQRVIDAAPALAAIRLESVVIDATNEEATQAKTCRLRCPAATVLVLDSCTWEEDKRQGSSYYDKNTIDVDRVEIDAPRLRRFRYKGLLRSFLFSSQPLELEQVDLDFSERERDCNKKDKDPDRELETFWRFARSFTSTKEMRLRVNYLEDYAVLNEARRVQLLPAFRRLECLEVQGVNLTKGKTPVMTILNLLRCCPKIAALRINLTAEHRDHASNKEGVPTQTSQKEIQIAAMLGPSHHFKCLQNSLKRVGLKFQPEKSDCLGIKLIKFFADNAMVLKEMHIDSGDEKFCEHMNPKTEKWNSKRRKLGAATFKVLPLNS